MVIVVIIIMIAKALHLLFVLHTSKLFSDTLSFNPYNNHNYFYSAGNWNTGRLSNLGKVPKLCRQKDWVPSPGMMTQSACAQLPLCRGIYSNYSYIYEFVQ